MRSPMMTNGRSKPMTTSRRAELTTVSVKGPFPANGDRWRGRLAIPLRGIAGATANAGDGHGDRWRGRLAIPLRGIAGATANAGDGHGDRWRGRLAIPLRGIAGAYSQRRGRARRPLARSLGDSAARNRRCYSQRRGRTRNSLVPCRRSFHRPAVRAAARHAGRRAPRMLCWRAMNSLAVSTATAASRQYASAPDRLGELLVEGAPPTSTV